MADEVAVLAALEEAFWASLTDTPAPWATVLPVSSGPHQLESPAQYAVPKLATSPRDKFMDPQEPQTVMRSVH